VKLKYINTFLRLLFAIVLLTGCAEFSKLKVDPDGHYRFEDIPIQVRAPKDCLLEMFVYEGPEAVGFMTGRGYWMLDGYYELQVWDRPDAIAREVDFFRDAYKISKDYIKAEAQRRKMRLEWQSMEFLDEYPVPAFQTLGVDSERGRVLASFTLQENYITVVSLQYPMQSLKGEPMEIPWGCYNRFLESVREIKQPVPDSG